MTRRILVADDEPDILATIGYALRSEGFEVDSAEDGEAALAAALAGNYDVVVLDVLMPKLSGMEVCRRLRARSIVPIVMVTAKDAELDRVLGLEVGADDYVTKPFSMAELVSRIRAILRRRELERAAHPSMLLDVGGLSVDLERHEAVVDGKTVDLTPSEFRLLALLARELARVFSRRQIMEHLWDSAYIGDARACDAHVSNLRQKIERDPAHPTRIVTVRQVGYKLTAI